MSSITAADLKLGGRLVAACDAIGAGHLRRAAGIFAEIADDLRMEAETTDGLLADEGDLEVRPLGESPVETAKRGIDEAQQKAAAVLQTSTAPSDLQSCARGAHSYGPTDPATGWRKCQICEMVNVAPPDDNGPIDVGIQALGDL